MQRHPSPVGVVRAASRTGLGVRGYFVAVVASLPAVGTALRFPFFPTHLRQTISVNLRSSAVKKTDTRCNPRAYGAMPIGLPDRHRHTGIQEMAAPVCG